MKNFGQFSHRFLKNHSSTILTCVGAAGVVATSIFTAKGVPKAIKLIEEVENTKGEKLTKFEKIKVAAPAYIPAIVIGASTIACIFGANILNKNQQASIMSAYALLNKSYNQYKNKVEELYGEEANDSVQAEIAKETYYSEQQLKKENGDETGIPEGEVLFFDFSTLRYFNSTVDKVLQKITMDDGMECYIISTPLDLYHVPNDFY